MFNGSGLTESSIKSYTANLKRLNNGVVPTTPNFLKKTAEIDEKIKDYALNTKKAYYIAIVSYLKTQPKFPAKTQQHYYKQMMALNQDFNKIKGEKSQQQKDNWITWDEVLDIYHKLDKTSIEYLVLSLFVLMPPRRSKDYTLMKVVPKITADLDLQFNYLQYPDKMVFNQYKTKGTYGSQTIEVPEELQKVFVNMLHLPKKFEPFLLLQNSKGKQLAESGLTLILNKVFDKKISSSMLRNIYASSKFGKLKRELDQTSEAMGTSSNVLSGVYTKE